jgi:hypothetical protein
MLILLGAHIAQGRVQVPFVIIDKPGREFFTGLTQAGKLLQPEELFFQSPYKLLGLGVALGVIKAG